MAQVESLKIAGSATEFSSSHFRNYRQTDSPTIEVLSRRLSENYGGHETGWVEKRYGRDTQEDPQGFFTKESILVIAGNEEPEAMLALASKRGGAIKITAFATSRPRAGIELVQEVMDLLRDHPYIRKIYATASNQNYAVLRLCDRLGFTPEAVLPNQYKEGSDEIVLGKVLKPHPSNNPTFDMDFDNDEYSTSSRLLDPNTDTDNLGRLFEYLSGWHDDVGRDFLEQTLRGAEFGAVDIMRKGKTIFVAEKDKSTLNGVLILDPKFDLSGSIVLTGKMGGPIKMYPLLGDEESQRELIRSSRQVSQENGFRIAYTFSPVEDSNEAEFLESMGFKPRGTLIEPYKPGVNLTPWSTRIEEIRL